MSVKIARKPSSDPVQEKLRQDKANWNKEMSLFLNDVIHLKKLMNGWPSKFYKERSRIVEPIPADPSTIIGSLANDFQELSQRGNGIVQEQLDYSKNRKPKQPKAPLPEGAPPASPTASPAPAAPGSPDLSKQLAAWEQKYDLVSEGSNPLSRFLTRRITRTRGISEKFRVNRMRLDMLSSCAKARKALSKLQVQIVKGNKQSILDSQKTMQHVWNEWAIVARSFNNYKSKMGTQLPDKSVELPTDEAMSPDKEVLPNQAPQDKEEILSEPPKAVVPVAPIAAPVVPAQPIVPKLPETLPLKEDELPKVAAMEVVAQAFLQKWLGKKRHQFFSGSSSSYRLEIFEIAKNIRVKLNEIMNLLEKGLDVGQLDPLISDVNRQMSSVRMLMRSLHLSEKPDASAGSFF